MNFEILTHETSENLIIKTTARQQYTACCECYNKILILHCLNSKYCHLDQQMKFFQPDKTGRSVLTSFTIDEDTTGII